MKKLLLISFLSILGFNGFAQITFQKGYFIKNNEEQVNCLIRNIDELNTPSGFDYKLSADAELEKAEIESIKEFGIVGEAKYRRFEVAIDLSSDNLGALDTKRSVQFEQKQLFLKVLLEGKANLYTYQRDNTKKFFYNFDNSTPKQLVYKRYKVEEDKIRKNNQYQQQLWNELKCQGLSQKSIGKLSYKKRSLIKFFTKYNTCKQTTTIVYKNKKKRKAFKLSLRPRLNSSFISIDNKNKRNGIQYIKLPVQNKFQFGLEVEYILPFNSQRWSIFIEPVYKRYQTELRLVLDYRYIRSGIIWYRQDDFVVTADYTSVELPVGFRYHVLAKNKFKLFVTAAYAFDFRMSSVLQEKSIKPLFYNPRAIEFSPRHKILFGIGANYKHKYSIELQYGPPRELHTVSNWDAFYHSFSVILGYNVL